MDPPQVQEWLGHGSVMETMRYAHLAEGHGDELIKLLAPQPPTPQQLGTWTDGLFRPGPLPCMGMAGEDEARERMVTETIASRGVSDPRVLAAMRGVERHRFVPASQADRAHDDSALPIGHDATISQPYIVALMTELAALQPGDRVLEIGTGSGYQAAVFAELGAEVFSIERVEALAERARERLREAGYEDVRVRHGDGYLGWPEASPFQAIVLTAAPAEIPRALLDQLAPGGRLIAPIGDGWVQSLVVVERGEKGSIQRHVCDVMFVPMLPGLREG